MAAISGLRLETPRAAPAFRPLSISEEPVAKSAGALRSSTEFGGAPPAMIAQWRIRGNDWPAMRPLQ
ncbi:hypothetical protein LBMAG53_15680 [Planctomycetota bacterium]|nr:hypothetical protein LBMAG53_15680 [Planctomycetota bacterium]